MRKRFAVIMMMATITAATLSGCGGSGNSNPNTSDQTTEVASTTTAEAPVQISAEDADSGFAKLYKKTMAYVESGDRDGFATLFRNTDPEAISQSFDGWAKVRDDDYPDQQHHIILTKDNYAVAEQFNSLTTGTIPNTKSMWDSNYFVISYEDGLWKYDDSDEANSACKDEIVKIYPKEMTDAANAGRNSYMLENDFTWAAPDFVIPGCIDGRAYLAWQNEDGSVDMYVNIKNGSDEIQQINQMNLELKDDKLGQILSTTVNGTDMLKPHSSANYTIHVEADDVKTGTDTWGTVNASCNYQY